MFADQVDHAFARPRRRKIEINIGEFNFRSAVQSHRYIIDNGFGQLDHRREIDIGLIEFQ